jgi:hypothetical protein
VSWNPPFWEIEANVHEPAYARRLEEHVRQAIVEQIIMTPGPGPGAK